MENSKLKTQNSKLIKVANQLKEYAKYLGFSQCKITDLDLSDYSDNFKDWLQQNYYGDMHWLADSMIMRTNPQQLLADSLRCISVSYDYWDGGSNAKAVLANSDLAYVSRYALGRDYHKLMRKKLAKLGKYIENLCEQSFNWRPFVDSAPVLEKPLAAKAGIGWVGKNTLILNTKGSYFFLGELFIGLPLPPDTKVMSNQCGSCRACLKVCPTDAFVNEYVLDSSKCISYLTIEHQGTIAKKYRKAIGNRVFGCDDCQLFCPWNRHTATTADTDFKPRHNLNNSEILELFMWSQQQFLNNTEGSAIRRVGYNRWLRNLAIALGNSVYNKNIENALMHRLLQFAGDTMLAEHFAWALAEQKGNEELRIKN